MAKHQNRPIRRLIAVLIALIWLDCASHDLSLREDLGEAALYRRAQQLYEDKMYDEAIVGFEKLLNRYPLTPHSTDAELKIALAYFKSKQFELAATAFKNFRKLHPKSDHIPEVLFQMAESFYHIAPKTIDRDISRLKDAETLYVELVTLYPDHSHRRAANARIKELRKKFAARERYIADFYFKRKKYTAAMKRYQGIVDQYTDTDVIEWAYFRVAICYFALNDRENGVKVVNQFKVLFPNSNKINQLNQLAEK